MQTNIYMSRHGGYIEQICYHISYRIFYFRLHSINTACVPYFILADGGSLSKQEIKLQAAFWDLYKAICQRLKSTNFYVAALDRGRGCQKGRQKSMQGRAGHWAGLERRSSAQTRAWRAAIQYGGKKLLADAVEGSEARAHAAAIKRREREHNKNMAIKLQCQTHSVVINLTENITTHGYWSQLHCII